MRTITLELLRHGPAHNQLLSPLTQYLAICENHAAVTVHMPFEHNQFLHRLHALGYQLQEESRQFQLKDTAKVLGEVLAEIPGLTAELNRECGDSALLTHLRLIISASELALLPFELALAPNGFPGAGQPLLLQSQLPLCVTREIRRVAEDHLRWLPIKPRILFAAAAPPGVGPVPVESHLLALRRVIDPWIRYYDSPDTRRKRVKEHLVFLPQATADAIEHACATGNFTHVHILAHGVEMREGYDIRFGLALHDARDPQGKPDLVNGARLATLIRASQASPGVGLARPAVVTIASCNSGNVGSVAGAGASVAHALHEAGIPMVVAGQFPLSFAGSIRMVQVLYEGLLWGADPRVLLSDLRRRLHSELPLSHDWASVTAYASLPTGFDEQISDVQIRQAKRSIDAALNHADEAARRFSRKLSPHSDKPDAALLERAQEKIDRAKRRMEDLLRRMPSKRSLICGLLASTEKRYAELLFSQGEEELSLACVRKAIDYYWDAFLADRTASWGIVQHLSLTLILQKKAGSVRQEREQNTLWTVAHALSLNDLNGADKSHTVWAHANLIELNLLSLLLPSAADRPAAEEARRLAREHTKHLVAIAGRSSFDLYSTRRQILRYVEFFSQLAGGLGDAADLAEELFDAMPEGIEENWR